MSEKHLDWKKLQQKRTPQALVTVEAAQELPAALAPLETPSSSLPPAEGDDNPFATETDETAIDTILDLIHSNEHDSIKAVLKETNGVTGVDVHATYAQVVLGKGSKTEMLDRALLSAIYRHSMGFKGARAQQAFEALKQQINNTLFPQDNKLQRAVGK